MNEIGAYDAKTHLPRLLKQVEAGQSITITRNGRAVARLTPVTNAQDAATRIIALRKSVARAARDDRLSMRALIEEGRR
jgi:prevent-host-death family protein